MFVLSSFLWIGASLAVFHEENISPRSMLNRKRATRAGMTAVPASFISFGGIWSETVDLFIFRNPTFLRSDRWDPVISLTGGGSALRFRIKSGSRHSIAVGGCRSSSANFSLILEKYQFIKAPPPMQSKLLHLLLWPKLYLPFAKAHSAAYIKSSLSSKYFLII